MAVPFGFSVGDCLAVGKLIGQVAVELSENSEAAPEFQSLLIELEALKRALFKLHALRPVKNELSQLTSIRATALACQRPLEDFLSKITKFESRLGTFNAANNKWKGLPRRMQFRIMFKEDVKKLRATLASHVGTINLLLMTQAVASISIAEDDRQLLASSLEDKIIEHRRLLHDIGDHVDRAAKQQHAVNFQLRQQHFVLDHLGRQADRTAEQMIDQNAQLENIQTIASQTQTQTTSIFATVSEIFSLLTSGVLYLRDIGEQLQRMVRLCSVFTTEMRTAMTALMNLFSSIQVTLQQMNHYIASRVHLPIVRFTTALGDNVALPWQLCQQWSTFSELLNVVFLDKPGKSRVNMGKYLIMNARGGRLVNENSWHHAVKQDDHLSMSMVLEDLVPKKGKCLYPSCQAFLEGLEIENGGQTCLRCGRWSCLREIDMPELEFPSDADSKLNFNPKQLINDGEDIDLYRQISVPISHGHQSLSEYLNNKDGNSPKRILAKFHDNGRYVTIRRVPPGYRFRNDAM